MKPVTLDIMTEYKYLSDLQMPEDSSALYFVEAKADMERNDYCRRLQRMDTDTKEVSPVTGWMESCNYLCMKDGTLLLQKRGEGGNQERYVALDPESGEEKEVFSLPLRVNRLREIDEEFLLAEATVNKACPDYHHLSPKEQAAFEEEKRKNQDYIVFDEYPFYYNGQGIINGDRNTLILIKRKNGEMADLVPSTVEVQSYDVDGDEILYSGVDYTDVRGLWSHIWKVNIRTGERELLFSDRMLVIRVFWQNHQKIVFGTFGEKYGIVEYGDFYELENGKMRRILKSDRSMHNSIGSDCRLGRTKNFCQAGGMAYFINTEGSRANILRFTGEALEKAVDFEGSCDDMAIGKESVYVVALKDMRLQEIYEVKGDSVTRLTAFNEGILQDTYIAVPEKITVTRKVPVDGWVLRPKDYDPEQTYPAILDIHGGPVTAYGEVFYHEMQAWASMGYFVMFCNPHGSDGRGNAFCDFQDLYGKDDYDDLMAFVDTVLERYPAIDKERLGVTGGSYGGYMTNWIIGHTNRFRAAVSQRSISNWVSQVCYSDYGIDFPFERRLEDVYNCHDELWEVSPLKYVNRVTTPTLFIQSTEDYRCPFTEAVQMFTGLRCRGIEAKLVGFKGENHDLSRSGKPKHRLRRLHEITNWMESHLRSEK